MLPSPPGQDPHQRILRVRGYGFRRIEVLAVHPAGKGRLDVADEIRRGEDQLAADVPQKSALRRRTSGAIQKDHRSVMGKVVPVARIELANVQRNLQAPGTENLRI